jgi:hypothetical protein
LAWHCVFTAELALAQALTKTQERAMALTNALERAKAMDTFALVIEELDKHIMCMCIMKQYMPTVEFPPPFNWWARYLDMCMLDTIEYYEAEPTTP